MIAQRKLSIKTVSQSTSGRGPFPRSCVSRFLFFIKEYVIFAHFVLSFLPQTRIIRSAFCRHGNQQTLIAVMNSIVGIVTGRDKVFGIEQNIGTVGDVLCGDGIHVVNENPVVNIEAFRAEVTAVVAEDDEVTH